MSRRRCDNPECGKLISLRATACPHCKMGQAPPPPDLAPQAQRSGTYVVLADQRVTINGSLMTLQQGQRIEPGPTIRLLEDAGIKMEPVERLSGMVVCPCCQAVFDPVAEQRRAGLPHAA